MTSSTHYLGKTVNIIIDRPLGNKHPKHGFIYEVNYGYVPGTMMPDGEELDAYYLGADKPLEKVKGVCIAVVRRDHENDDKLVVVAEGKDFSNEEIEKLVKFQEKWFKHKIIR